MTGYVPLPTNHSPATSTSAPRPTSIFEPSSPQQLMDDQNTESSPQNSLPCGQRTPTGSTSTSDTPSPHTPTHHTSPNPINHKTYHIHLLKQMLTCLLSLLSQMKNNSVYPNQQVVVK